MKLTASYFKSIESFTFAEEKPLFNFEANENKTLAELIPEIDALYGVVQYTLLECFEETLFCGNAELQNENKTNRTKKDLQAMSIANSQSSMQHNENVTLKEVNLEAKFTEVEKEAFASLSKRDQKIQTEDFQILQKNKSGKSLNSEENKSESESECRDIQASQNQVQGQRERPHREFGVKLKRWGRNEDRKVFSYRDNHTKVARVTKCQLLESTNIRDQSLFNNFCAIYCVYAN